MVIYSVYHKIVRLNFLFTFQFSQTTFIVEMNASKTSSAFRKKLFFFVFSLQEADERNRQLQQQLNRVEKDHEMQAASATAEMRFEYEEKLQALQAHIEAREAKILELNSRIQQSEENTNRRISELKNQASFVRSRC